MIKDVAALHRHITALVAHSPSARLHQLLWAISPEMKSTIFGSIEEWNLFLLDIEGFLTAHTMALTLLDHLMQQRQFDVKEQ